MPWQGPLFDGHVCSLGYEVLDWIHAYCCHGPGDVQGEPLNYDDEIRDFVVECYRLDPETGRRLYREAVLSRPKGRAKSEIAGMIVCAEALGPVRFSGWDATGQPVGRPIQSPLIKCLATEESQAGNTFENAAFVLGVWGPDVHPDIFAGVGGVRRAESATAVYIPGGGEVRACTSGSASKDGGKETFVVPDEALALDTRLPTPDGWTTMGEVQVGDFLIGADGSPVRVVKATDVMKGRQCWRVSFRDGTSLVASDGHLWQTRVSGSAALPKVRTTGEMVRDGRRFRVPRAAGLVSQDVALPIDPYILGLWLGDGDKNAATIACSRSDAPQTIAQIEARGYTAKPTKVKGDRADRLYVSLPGSHRNRFSPVRGLLVQLRDEGLLDNKHIPNEYLRAGREQRLDLLRGLMDSDGHVDESGCCVFVQTDPGLVHSFLELLRSLGQEAAPRFVADERSRQGGYYKVHFSPVGIVPFSLPRKIDRCRATGRRDGSWVSIVSIEPVDTVPVRCVGVDSPDSLFLAGEGWKVTHNSHLYVLPELKRMYATVMRNLPKRKLAEPWALQTSTAYRPGEQSIFEQTLTAWRKGELPAGVHVDHREAKGRINIDDSEHTLRQLRQVYGAAMDPKTGWMDPRDVLAVMRDPRSCPDVETAARYYLNRPMSGQDAWIPKDIHERQTKVDVVEPGTAIALGFDGSLNDDSTVLRGCRMSDGYLFRVGLWAKPDGPAGIGWEVPRLEVLAAIREAHERYDVIRGYYDPHEWRSDVESLAETYGETRVIAWATSRHTPMAAALDRLHTGLKTGEIWHDDDPVAAEHYGNVYVARRGQLRLVRKEYPNSPRKIDTVIGDALALEARADAIAAGWSADPVKELPPLVFGM